MSLGLGILELLATVDQDLFPGKVSAGIDSSFLKVLILFAESILGFFGYIYVKRESILD